MSQISGKNAGKTAAFFPKLASNGGKNVANGGENAANGHKKFANGHKNVANGHKNVANGGKKVANGGENVANRHEKVANGGENVANGGESDAKFVNKLALLRAGTADKPLWLLTFNVFMTLVASNAAAPGGPDRAEGQAVCRRR